MLSDANLYKYELECVLLCLIIYTYIELVMSHSTPLHKPAWSKLHPHEKPSMPDHGRILCSWSRSGYIHTPPWPWKSNFSDPILCNDPAMFAILIDRSPHDLTPRPAPKIFQAFRKWHPARRSNGPINSSFLELPTYPTAAGQPPCISPSLNCSICINMALGFRV